jgi:molybdopterin-binding protein
MRFGGGFPSERTGSSPFTGVAGHGTRAFDARTARLEVLLMELSARNQLRGRITGIHVGDILGEVEVELELNPVTITATITTSSIQRLALKMGDRVTAIIKSTEVLIGK